MSTHYSVSVRNRDGRVVAVSEDEFLLDALEGAGMRLPYGCRFGACVTCAALLIEGQVDQTGGRSFALRPQQEDEGYVLLCVARPLADCVIDVGTRRELYVNPFKHLRTAHQDRRIVGPRSRTIHPEPHPRDGPVTSHEGVEWPPR